MVIPFRFENPGKALPAKFGQRLIPMWSFGETSDRSVKPMRLQCARPSQIAARTADCSRRRNPPHKGLVAVNVSTESLFRSRPDALVE
jgi:hypothetical protein